MTATNLPALIQGADGVFRADSRDVARTYGKQHAHVLRAIEGHIKTLPGTVSNFGEGYYTLQETGEQRHKLYLMDRRGFSLLVLKFTGQKAAEFTLAYIDLFESMATQLQAVGAPAKQLAIEDMLEAAAASIRAKNAQLEIEAAARLLSDQRAVKAEGDLTIAHNKIGELVVDNSILSVSYEIVKAGRPKNTMLPSEFVAHYAGVTGNHTVSVKKFESWFKLDGAHWFFTFVNRRKDGKNIYKAKAEHDTRFGFIPSDEYNPNIPGDKVSKEDEWFIYVPTGAEYLVRVIKRDIYRTLPIYFEKFQNQPLTLIAGGRA